MALSGDVIVYYRTPEADERIRRVLYNEPLMGIFRHADAGYEDALRCASQHGVSIPTSENLVPDSNRG